MNGDDGENLGGSRWVEGCQMKAREKGREDGGGVWCHGSEMK